VNVHFRFRPLLIAGYVSLACGSSLPEPARGRHHPSDYREVPYPPPAALVETVPKPPDDRAVWVDGYWDFAQGGYIWRRGGWIHPPEGSFRAPWSAYYTTDGRLLFAKTLWFDRRGKRLPEPDLKRPAYTPPNEITGEFQAPR
jgi:hypothetical protein